MVSEFIGILSVDSGSGEWGYLFSVALRRVVPHRLPSYLIGHGE